LSLHTEFLPLFENAALLREILTWKRECSRQLQDFKNLKERANKCIDQRGMYFEE
jgi:hypothetical protein